MSVCVRCALQYNATAFKQTKIYSQVDEQNNYTCAYSIIIFFFFLVDFRSSLACFMCARMCECVFMCAAIMYIFTARYSTALCVYKT